MALRKEITFKNGVSADYWKAANPKIVFEVQLFKDEETRRTEDSEPVARQGNIEVEIDPMLFDLIMQNLYGQLKAGKQLKIAGEDISLAESEDC